MSKLEVFYKMSGVSINSINVTPSNISTFGLYKRYESKIADIYSTRKKAKVGQFIIHVKDPIEYAKGNSYLMNKNEKYPSVDWFEHYSGSGENLDDDIDYIEERL